MKSSTQPHAKARTMWFTRISIHNPVMAVMVMLAFVVLGLFSYQRLSLDQFPNIDVPTVVVVMDYPGASPEIVEAEVTKKVEEAVNTVAGISALYSRTSSAALRPSMSRLNSMMTTDVPS